MVSGFQLNDGRAQGGKREIGGGKGKKGRGGVHLIRGIDGKKEKGEGKKGHTSIIL